MNSKQVATAAGIVLASLVAVWAVNHFGNNLLVKTSAAK